jgi:hypothetical protein
VELKWQKASRSHATGACVEVAMWQKAAASSPSGNCVEVIAVPNDTQDGTLVAVRDSKDPDGPILRYTKAEFAAFLDGAKNGEFDAYAKE